MSRRFSSRSLTGMLRELVAVGTVRLCSMLSTMILAGPVIGLEVVSDGNVVDGFADGTLPDGRVSARSVWGTLAADRVSACLAVSPVAAGAAVVVAEALPSPLRSPEKYSCQDSSTEAGFA